MAGNGCFKNLFASIGCLTVLVVGGIVGWHFRAQLAGVYHSVVGAPPAADTAAAASVGVPSAEALRRAERKEDAIAARGGPAYVQLSADEMASLIEARLDPIARRALDSVRVVLAPDRFVMEGQILLQVFSRDALGPLADLLGSRQPIRVGGMAEVAAPGDVRWRPDEFVIRAFPFPSSAIPRLVNHLSGGTTGTFAIPVPSTVGALRILPDGVTFYRRSD
jgi:hypothetical protein